MSLMRESLRESQLPRSGAFRYIPANCGRVEVVDSFQV